MTVHLAPQPHTPRLLSFSRLLLLLGFILLGGTLTTMAIAGVLMVVHGLSFPETQTYLQDLVTRPETFSGGWYRLMLLQGISHIGMFLLPTLVFWFAVEKNRWQDFQQRPLRWVALPLLVPVMVVAFMPFDSSIIEWNRNIHLPDAWQPLEEWMRAKDTQLTDSTKYLTTFQTPLQLLLALLVVGLIPAVGEEVLFRGVIQRALTQWTRNVHVGVWAAALLFSAIHVQFLGFVPRMLLGALFGYLYVWSGNLWIPILAHFTNNGFTVLMMYLYQRKVVPIDIESNESLPMPTVLLSALLTAGLLYLFQQKNKPQHLL